MKKSVGLVAALSVLGVAAAAQAVVIVPGTYRLSNHPDGEGEPSAPPGYGMVLDDLYDVGPKQDPYTLDFENPAGAMFMDVSADFKTIRIYGTAASGIHDVDAPGGGWLPGPEQGISSVDFTYNVGVEQVPGDDDLWVVAKMGEHNNTGTLTTPTAEVVDLWDEPMDFGFSFRLGDDDDDAGLGFHKVPGTITGFGWLNYRQPDTHVFSTDFIFNAELIPAPSSLALLGLGLVGLRRRR